MSDNDGWKGNSMKCIICGVGTARKVQRKRLAKYNGESVEVPRAEAYRCEGCGEEFLTPDQAKEYTKAVKNEVRKKQGR